LGNGGAGARAYTPSHPFVSSYPTCELPRILCPTMTGTNHVILHTSITCAGARVHPPSGLSRLHPSNRPVKAPLAVVWSPAGGVAWVGACGALRIDPRDLVCPVRCFCRSVYCISRGWSVSRGVVSVTPTLVRHDISCLAPRNVFRITLSALDSALASGLYWMHYRGRGPRDGSKGSKNGFSD